MRAVAQRLVGDRREGWHDGAPPPHLFSITIEGMMCGHCEATVKKALEALEGVISADVSHDKGTAVVALEKDVADDILTKAVEDKDFKVTGIS